jgi:hypothetical protein
VIDDEICQAGQKRVTNNIPLFTSLKTDFTMFPAQSRKSALTCLVLFWMPIVESFSSAVRFGHSSKSSPCTKAHSHNMLPPDLGSNLLLSVDLFDGSSIVDPVVVSGSFWSSLQRQLLSVILGQLVAAVVFTLLASLFAAQLSSLREFVLSKFGSGTSSSNSNNNINKEFIRADSSEYRRATVQPDFGKLLICIAIDLVGSSSELIPILGELTDIVTAPLAATLLQNQFGGSKVVFFLEFAEEILPFTDVIPFATLCWVIDTYFPESDIAGVFQLGNFRATNTLTQQVIDVTAESTEGNSKKDR